MTLKEAYKKVTSVVSPLDIDYFVEMDGGWVVIGKPIIQAIYVTAQKMIGLNLLKKEDRSIIVKAEEKISKGEYF